MIRKRKYVPPFLKEHKTYFEKRDERVVRMGFSSYACYLKSDLWQGIRSQVMERDQGRCRCCGDKAAACHHQSYKRSVLAGRKIEAIVAVCGGCHKSLHRKVWKRTPRIRPLRIHLIALREDGHGRPWTAGVNAKDKPCGTQPASGWATEGRLAAMAVDPEG